jgi:hypothetical protein
MPSMVRPPLLEGVYSIKVRNESAYSMGHCVACQKKCVKSRAFSDKKIFLKFLDLKKRI